MQAILLSAPGVPENLYLGETPTPVPGPREVRVCVAATALNRADTLQRQGKYPPPPGASDILGLEMAGVVESLGPDCKHAQVGQRVCGLLSGGGYAEYVVIHEDMLLPVPDTLSLTDAAGIPEVFLTAYQALVLIANLRAGEQILIHAGASGVGTAATQLARRIGATVWVTASAGKHHICQQMGARHIIDYRAEDFSERVKEGTEGKGVNVILDFLAAAYFQQNLNSLALDGRMVMLSLMGGIKVPELNLVNMLRRRLQVTGSTLRSRTLDYKIELTRRFREDAWADFATGTLRPVIDRILPLGEVAVGHTAMEANENAGKIILQVNADLD
ncbi:MAG: NAD(P)H-quinone oxidoreductase [Bacteroidota bacterium]